MLKFKFKSTSLNLNCKPFCIVDNFIHNTTKTPLPLNSILYRFIIYYRLEPIITEIRIFKFKNQSKILNSKPYTNRSQFLNLKKYIQPHHLNLKILLWITNFKFKSTQNSYLWF